MGLADSNRAIGAVTSLLVDHLIRRTTLAISATHPRTPVNAHPRLNIFLFETTFDPSLKNFSLQDGQPAPLWLILRYVLTAFDTTGQSDTPEAHELMGRGLAALQEVNFLQLDNSVAQPVRRALENNPEALKITFDEASSELISKLMQGPDETYRFSMGFQVRPVMILPAVTPSYNLLVGVDYETVPPSIIGDAGVLLNVLPSLGPRLETIEPDSFEAPAANPPKVVVHGAQLQLANLECLLGPVHLPIVKQWPDRIVIEIDAGVASGTLLSAGEHPFGVRQPLGSGRYRSSNLLTVRLLPVLQALTANVAPDPNPPHSMIGTLQATGILLGKDVDDIQVAFYAGGKVVYVIDVQAPIPTGAPPASEQTSLTVALTPNDALPAGSYRIIWRVNGQQARNSPTLVLS
jgi:hypothetical protein